MKTCTKCKETKPVDAFHNRKAGRDGRAAACKDCANAKTRAWVKLHPEKQKARWRKRTLAGTVESRRVDSLRTLYKLSPEQYDEIFAGQGGGCAACGAPPSGEPRQFHVDHDHECCPGRITCGQCLRGILCGKCNLTLGHARDSIERLLALVDYLRRWQDADREQGGDSRAGPRGPAPQD